MTDLNKLSAQLAETHIEHPQRAQLAQLALDEVKSGIAKLASLGHRFELAIAGTSPVEIEEFPKALYNSSGESLIVAGPDEEDAALGTGLWWEGQDGAPAPVAEPEPKPELPATFRFGETTHD